MKAKMEYNTASPAVIGIDIGKEVFHLVGLGADGKIAFRQRREPPRRCGCFCDNLCAYRDGLPLCNVIDWQRY